MEAAHRLGLRVVVEFVFRTAAKDGDWVKEHPEWMYWIKESVPPRGPGEQDERNLWQPDLLRVKSWTGFITMSTTEGWQPDPPASGASRFLH